MERAVRRRHLEHLGRGQILGDDEALLIALAAAGQRVAVEPVARQVGRVHADVGGQQHFLELIEEDPPPVEPFGEITTMWGVTFASKSLPS